MSKDRFGKKPPAPPKGETKSGEDTSEKIVRPRARCLVIQMARLGDTIQSLMALRAAKQLYPELEIHFVAREKFAAAAKRVPWLDEVITLPTESMLAPVIEGKKDRVQAVGDLAAWMAPLLREPWDFVVNWSYSQSSSYLTGIIPARVKLGFTRDNGGAFRCVDGWSHYLQAVILGGIDQNIHLTDVLTTQLLTALQIHLGEPADNGNATVTSKGFFSLELSEKDLGWHWRDSSRRWIGIQMGASHATKAWDAENWAKTASYILKRHSECGIVLLGGEEDSERARLFQEKLTELVPDRKPVISMVGKTDFDLWASVVGQCQWIFSADTAVIHLASVLGTRVLNVSTGPVRWNETGPYGNGHYVISPQADCKACHDQSKDIAAHSCRSAITPEAVYAVWAYASSEWAHRRQMGIESHFSQLGFSSDLPAIQIYRSKIRSTDDGGGVTYEPSIPRSIRVRDWTSQVMGHIARAWYCGWTPAIGQELSRNVISPTLVQELRNLDESAGVLSRICTEAVRTAAALQQRSSKLKSDKIMGIQDRQALSDLGKKVQELDTLIERMGATHPAMRAFAQMSKVLMHNLSGELLSDLGRESALSYQQLHQGVTILKDWIGHTLNLARPIAIQGASVIPLHSTQAPSPSKDLV